MEDAALEGAKAVAAARDVVLALAPGFLALKVFQVFGAQRKRSEWEWTAWSVLVAALISVLPLQYWAQLVTGIALGFGLATGWHALPRLGVIGAWASKALGNSAWDLALDRAVRQRCVVEVAIGEGADEERLFGRLNLFGYEQYEAEPWIYLSSPQRRPPGGKYAPMERAVGVLVHRDNIKWLRVLRKVD